MVELGGKIQRSVQKLTCRRRVTSWFVPQGSSNPRRTPGKDILLDSKDWRQNVQAVYILSAARTPIGKFGGSLVSCTAADMGVVAAKAAIERAGVHPEQIEETIFGNARQ